MENNDFEEVQKQDMKSSGGFYLFMLIGLVASVIWLICGGAEDGAWWGVGISGGLLIINALMNWWTRPKNG